MNVFTKQKQTHRLREWAYGYQRGKGGGKGQLGSLGKEKRKKANSINSLSSNLIIEILAYFYLVLIASYHPLFFFLEKED